jgi:hypothetical protein
MNETTKPCAYGEQPDHCACGDATCRYLPGGELTPQPVMRTFGTGATRDLDASKYDHEAFLSPLVIEAFGRYMHRKRQMADGSLRDGDNWQKGIPLSSYIKSAWRHLLDWWKLHRGYQASETIEDALCAIMFNAMGYLHEHLKAKGESNVADSIAG